MRPADNPRGVSPVIAVILLVAIAVVLSAVLYAMLSGLVVRPGTSALVGVVVEPTPDGQNWSVRIVAAQGSLPTTSTYLVVRNPGGDTILNPTAFSDLPTFEDNTSPGQVSPGDALRLDVATYPPKSTVVILSDEKVLWEGLLRS